VGEKLLTGENEAPSAVWGKLWWARRLPQRTDERSRRWQHRKRSFIGLCVVAPGIHESDQAAGLPTSFSFFSVKKKDTFKQEFTVLLPKK